MFDDDPNCRWHSTCYPLSDFRVTCFSTNLDTKNEVIVVDKSVVRLHFPPTSRCVNGQITKNRFEHVGTLEKKENPILINHL